MSFSAPTAYAANAEVPKRSFASQHSNARNRWEETVDLEAYVDTYFGRKRLCVKTAHPVSILETFNIIVKG
ncbi:hypothetical protein Tco_1230432, partial [Tanacetum coccineum]